MPLNRTVLTQSGHQTFGFLTVFTWGEPVAVYDVDTTPTFPAFNLDATLDSGDAAEVRHGMLYVVETAGGLFKGQGTVRYAGTISSGNLPVRELSYGQIPVAAGDVVKVYRYWPLGDKLVAAKDGFPPDNATYTNQNDDYRPLANDGGLYVGDTSMLPFPFTGSLSSPVASTADLNHDYTLPAGLSFDSGVSTDEDVMVTGDAGQYWVQHDVEDDDTGATTERYVPVRIHDDNDPPYDCILEGDVSASMSTGGWAATVRILTSGVTYEDVPEGALVAFWVKERSGGTVQSFGAHAPGRSHIKLVGYIRRRTLSGSARQHTMVVEIVSPLSWWEENPNYSKVLTREEDPETFQEYRALDTKIANVGILHGYTNVNEIGFDVLFDDNYRVKDYPQFFIEKQSAPDQLREIASGVGARLICDRTGGFHFYTLLSLLPLGSRGAEEVLVEPTEDDAIDYEIQLEDRDTVEKLSFQGFTAGTSNNQPFVVSAPGKSPGKGSQSPVFDKIIEDSIASAEAEAGRRYGMVERIFVDSNGERRRSPKVTITFFGGFDVFDLLGKWVRLPAISRIKQTDIDLSAFRYEVDSISVDYSRGTARPQVTFLGETNASKGQYDPPTQTSPTQPSPDWNFDPGTIPGFSTAPVIEFSNRDLGITGLLVTGPTGSNVALAQDANGLPLSPTFMDRSSGLTGSAVYYLQVDPYGFDRFYGACSNGLWKTENIYTGTAWTQVLNNGRLDNAAHFYQQVLMSPYRQGWILAIAGQNHADVSFDYGNSWTTVNVSGGADTRTSTSSSGIRFAYAEISWHDTQGVIWVGISIGADPGQGYKLYKSTNWGLSFSLAGTFPSTTATESSRAFPPYLKPDGSANLPNAGQVLVARSGSAPGAGFLYFTSDAGSSFTEILDPVTDAWAALDTPHTRGIHGYFDTGLVYALLERDTPTAANTRVAVTDDGFATPPVALINQPALCTGGLGVEIHGLPEGDKGWLMVTDGAVGGLEITLDRGATPWINAVGDLASVFGDTVVIYAQPAKGP